MTKEERIKEAYEEVGLPFHENVMCNNGWMNIKPSQYERLYDKCDVLKKTNNVHRIRPKSLKGIENNNGWTALKGVKNEIQHDGDIWIFNKYGNVELWLEYQFLPIGYATHWKPIIKPNPPVW